MHYFCGVLIKKCMLLHLSDLGMVNVIVVVKDLPNNVNCKSNGWGRKVRCISCHPLLDPIFWSDRVGAF